MALSETPVNNMPNHNHLKGTNLVNNLVNERGGWRKEYKIDKNYGNLF